MNRLVCAVMVVAAISFTAPRDSSELSVMFWNLENYFDWRNDSTSVSDKDFSSRGERRWTKRRFMAKSNAIVKGIMWISATCGGLPDAIGLAEVENAFALRRLLQDTALQKLDYTYIHYDSPDRRGIDVALLYRTSKLSLTGSKPYHIYEDSTHNVMPTRDILLATFMDHEGRPLAILVNHHPSKYGGAEVSEKRRHEAVSALKNLADSLMKDGIERVVAIGDFNDTPEKPVYDMLSPPLVNMSLPLYRQGLGTIRYDGEWEFIDLCFVSGPMAASSAQKIIFIPFLMVPDKAHGGMKPLRTYSGPRYIGGVSDHCPILLLNKQ